MPIAVVCPGCKARFSVSDKFAGKKGPCPKCKGVIQVPEIKAEEVQIHAPEVFASAGKDTKGRPLSKPIPRAETKLGPAVIAAIAGVAVAALAGAIGVRFAGDGLRWPLVPIGLLALSPAVAVAGYSFLRDDELEPYRGRSLWLRATICAVVYAVLWGLFAIAQRVFGFTGETWQWLFLGAVFVPLGAAASWASLDLDFGSGSMHFSFYLLVTIVLALVANVPLSIEPEVTAPAPFGTTPFGGSVYR